MVPHPKKFSYSNKPLIMDDDEYETSGRREDESICTVRKMYFSKCRFINVYTFTHAF